jgi:hypothetical protein
VAALVITGSYIVKAAIVPNPTYPEVATGTGDVLFRPSFGYLYFGRHCRCLWKSIADFSEVASTNISRAELTNISPWKTAVPPRSVVSTI